MIIQLNDQFSGVTLVPGMGKESRGECFKKDKNYSSFTAHVHQFVQQYHIRLDYTPGRGCK